MARVNRYRVMLLAVAVATANSVCSFAGLAQSFDQPVRKAVVDLGLSPYLEARRSERVQLFCFYYPTFMVKQVNDPGLKGIGKVIVGPTPHGHVSTCGVLHGRNDRVVADDGFGFIGVKGSLLFLEAPDGYSGGVPFRILDLRNRKKVFEDAKSLTNRDIKFQNGPDGTLSLSYLRVVYGDCSITRDGAACWNKFRKHFGLELATPPTCIGNLGEPVIPADEAGEPSVVSYPVLVKLSSRPSIQAVAGPVSCTPLN